MCCFDLATVLDRTGTLLLLTLLFDSIIRYLLPFVTIVVLTPIPHYVLHTGMFLNFQYNLLVQARAGSEPLAPTKADREVNGRLTNLIRRHEDGMDNAEFLRDVAHN